MNSSIFNLLGNGAKFDKQQVNQMKLSQACLVNVKQHLPPQITSELDFFNVQPKEKKRKVESNVEHIIHQHDSSTIQLDPMTIPEAILLRKKHEIHVYGSDVMHPMRTFAELFQKYSIHSFLQKNINKQMFEIPTPIQMQSFPIMLEGRDLMACAPTGSGKTISFLLPILQDLEKNAKSGFRAVIISPTRELAQQIYRETKRLCEGRKMKICVLTKSDIAHNDSETEKLQNYDILISTPLRLVHLLENKIVKLDAVRHLVLDEADRLLELGFLEQMDAIITACTNPRLQKSLYTATLTSTIEALAQTFMKDPLRIVIGLKNTATNTIDQKLIFVGGEEGKMVALRQRIKEGIKPPVIIFVQSIERAKDLYNEFVYDKLNVDMIHSERTRAQRDCIIEDFRMGKVWILITTELMARGIDFKGVNVVINYDFPQSVASYIHRIGRCGRAGRTGEAITYFTKSDAPYLKSIVTVIKESGCMVEDWMMDLKKPSKQMKKDLRDNAIERYSIKTMSVYDSKAISHKRQMIADSKSKMMKGKGTEDSIEKK